MDTSYLDAPGATRTWLGAADLVAAKIAPASPLNNGYFMPVGANGPALNSFSGVITLSTFTMSTTDPTVDARFPAVPLRFFSDDAGDLIPMDRDILVPTNASTWRLLLDPGRVWSEPADNGWTRASFPFALVSRDWGDLRNGLATFLYNGASISSVRVQIVQETTGSSFQRGVNLWATLLASYSPQTFANHDAVIAQFQQETAGYLPEGPYTDIQAATQTTEAAFNDTAASTNLQVSYGGIVKDGRIYRQACHTRFGDYPYCQQMRVGAFSVSKSMGAAVALFRLAQKYGDGVAGLLIKDYVNVTATHDGWDHVTFLDALDMATGIGNASPNVATGTGLYTFDDEDNNTLLQSVFSAPGEKAMLTQAFMQGKYGWGPGVEVRYNSTHTFVLAAAMDAFLKSKEGPDAHLWDMVANEVYAPIGVLHAPMMHSIEPDGSRGIPFLAIGLYPTADDVAKVAMLLQHGGTANGQQLLSPALLATSLYKTSNQGLRGYSGWDKPFGQNRYLMSFWSTGWNDGAGCSTRVPYMVGAGGNFVALMPNGTIAFRMADTDDYNAMALFQAGANLGKMCPQ